MAYSLKFRSRGRHILAEGRERVEACPPPTPIIIWIRHCVENHSDS